MTLSEFKAWFEGYTEGLEAAPTKAQFDRIKEKVKEISGTPISQTVYIDRYVEPFRRYWASAYSAGGAVPLASMSGQLKGTVGTPFNSVDAMYALGKADAIAA